MYGKKLDTVTLPTLQVGALPIPPLLGMDVLGGYRVLMDFPAGRMYLAPPASLVPAICVGPPALASTPPGGPAPRQP